MALGFKLVFLCMVVYAQCFRCAFQPIEEGQEESWLRLHIVPASWHEARLRCHLEGGVIASPTSEALTSEMLTLMSAHGMTNGRVFTGINAVVSKGYYMSMDGVPLYNISLKWVHGEPNNYDNNEDCVVMTDQGELADAGCAIAHPFICSRNKANFTVNECGVTDKEYKMEPRTGSCYKFHRFARTWHQAAAACYAEGGHLAIINSPTESQVLKELFEKHPDHTIPEAKFPFAAYIGFWDWNEHTSDGEVYGEWLTIFGESLADAGFNVWEKDEPNNNNNAEYCGSMFRSGLLNDANCEHRLGFICEITPK